MMTTEKLDVFPVPPPNSVQIEPVEGCTLACWFCGIQSIRDNNASREEQTNGKGSGPFRFMALSTAETVASEMAKLGWKSRIEFAMHGEPTVHPSLVDIIRIFRQALPSNSIMLTTNGAGIFRKGVLSQVLLLFEAGVNTIMVDEYKHSRHIWASIRDTVLAEAYITHPYEVYEYPRDKSVCNPHHRFSGKRIILCHDISDNTAGNHVLTNQGGNSGPRRVVKRRCAKPFRELAVRWDGNVAVCCDDWKGQYKVGNVMEMSLQELWHHPRFEAARRMLYAKQRTFGPCAGCDVTTPRDGLLPDKRGQSDMREPDSKTKAILKEALSGENYTIKL